MGHPVPVVKEPPIEGEILPPATDREPVAITAEWVERRRAFIEECGRTYREVTEELGGDPLVSSQWLTDLVSDPWSNPKHIPKRYRDDDKKTPSGLALQTRRT